MSTDQILLLKGNEIGAALKGREHDILNVVARAYEAHALGNSSLPHSTFLRFPDDEKNRIIALPAYLGDGFSVAGIKWVSSFTANLNKGLDRASAVLILNSTETGRPEAIIEGSIISAKRTAASAALAAQHLLNGSQPDTVGLIGCGLIGFEIMGFLLAVCPQLKKLVLFDLDPHHAEVFKRECGDRFASVEIASDSRQVLAKSPLVVLATTAGKPHISDLSVCAPGTTILHVSLRDIAPEAILTCDNIVDDVDHVSRAQTSIHLAEQLTGTRDFVRCTLGEILLGRAAPRRDAQSVAVFSPFGLGVLDIALGKYACEIGLQANMGTVIGSFLPAPWAAGRV
ncbi:MAG TPA: 2,3-diaminopropionate biosynthesis protein SbnB [Pyrinomonadaceae bacterium]|nr:2,3-diaminopropionate biosynthesis protein SbnB [Pyrinomonadaceae bacterium]